jgi:hypothetical protein
MWYLPVEGSEVRQVTRELFGEQNGRKKVSHICMNIIGTDSSPTVGGPIDLPASILSEVRETSTIWDELRLDYSPEPDPRHASSAPATEETDPSRLLNAPSLYLKIRIFLPENS